MPQQERIVQQMYICLHILMEKLDLQAKLGYHPNIELHVQNLPGSQATMKVYGHKPDSGDIGV